MNGSWIEPVPQPVPAPGWIGALERFEISRAVIKNFKS